MSIAFNIATPKQKRFIFWHLGLDLKKSSNLSIDDAADLIGQMKKDPKFVYDYLVQNYGAKVLDPQKLQKAINKKEKSMTQQKTKAELCQDLYRSNSNLTAKQIAQKVDCDLSVVYRSLSKINNKSIEKTASKNSPLKYRQVLNHIKKTPNLQGDSALTLENLAESYNLTNGTSYSTNEFSRCMSMIVGKNYASKVGKGVYSLSGPSEEIKEQPQKTIELNSNKAYEYAVALHKIVGSEEAHKLIDIISKLKGLL